MNAMFPIRHKLAEVELNYAMAYAVGEKRFLKYGLDVSRDFASLAGLSEKECKRIAEKAKFIGEEEENNPSKLTFEELIDKVLE